jgi:lipopolysaccharide/colanic/teichoic acid biosynthesis glycosyltransferase
MNLLVRGVPRSPSPRMGGSDAARRLLDIFIAVAAMIGLSPLLFAISLAILLESGWPILFAQTRLGQYGRPFRMLKFRKFHAWCGTSGSPLTLQNDTRMTRIGAILQSTKLDELPQLWNVIEGSMSLVGPRPETPVFVDCFSGGFERVLDYKPGIVGPSQVMFRSESQFFSQSAFPDDLYRAYLFPIKASIDLEYYGRRTLLGDCAWLVRGAAAVLGVGRRLGRRRRWRGLGEPERGQL